MSDRVEQTCLYHTQRQLDWRLFGDELVVFNPLDNSLHIMQASLLPLLSCFTEGSGVSIDALKEVYQSLNLATDEPEASFNSLLRQWLALNIISCRYLH
ncbi:hypothetical protein [Motilimonas sp. KMU-193]|uniref:hypothetical protein n=1 Tax=Motilimonas sp. KMU-193 TaxID=3388668 RepID=UPI00396AF41A